MIGKVLSPNKVYEIFLLKGYELKENQDAVVVYDKKEGVGAVNITDFRIPVDYNFDLAEELKDFVATTDAEIDKKTLQIVSNEYSYTDFISRGRFWKVWTFFKNPSAVFASYNCEEKDKFTEIDKIEKIMQSLKIL